jgi:hypothetical protein
MGSFNGRGRSDPVTTMTATDRFRSSQGRPYPAARQHTCSPPTSAVSRDVMSSARLAVHHAIALLTKGARYTVLRAMPTSAACFLTHNA